MDIVQACVRALATVWMTDDHSVGTVLTMGTCVYGDICLVGTVWTYVCSAAT